MHTGGGSLGQVDFIRNKCLAAISSHVVGQHHCSLDSPPAGLTSPAVGGDTAELDDSDADGRYSGGNSSGEEEVGGGNVKRNREYCKPADQASGDGTKL